MPRYIDADALIDDFCGYAEANKGTYHEEGFKNAITVVEVAPTADVRENVHARWEESKESALRPYMCSNCGSLFDVDMIMGKLCWDFCPNCGAEMEENDGEIH